MTYMYICIAKQTFIYAHQNVTISYTANSARNASVGNRETVYTDMLRIIYIYIHLYFTIIGSITKKKIK